MSDLCDFGLIGLAVMGENLALNIESRGYRIAVFNRTTSKVDGLLQGRARGKNFVGCYSVEELVRQLVRPRKVMLLVKAGPAVDAMLDELAGLLEPGDIIIDGGNTHYLDTERRTQHVEQHENYELGGHLPSRWPIFEPAMPEGLPCHCYSFVGFGIPAR